MNTLLRLGFKPTLTFSAAGGRINTARRHVSTHQPRIHHHISESRKLAAEYVERITKSEFCVFTDGSRFPEGGVGAAARARTPSGTIIIKEYLGPAADHLSVEAELLGLSLGLRAIKTIPSLRVTQATLLVDCQEAIHEILSGRPRHAALVQRFHDEARSMLHLRQIRLAWVPGHHGVEMNELVDSDAKDAASGDSAIILMSSGFQLYLSQSSEDTLERSLSK